MSRLVPAAVSTRYGDRWRVMQDRLRDVSDLHRSTTIVVSMAIAAVLMIILPKLPPLNIIQPDGPWYDSFANAGVFVLLAMGLNVVVGLAGLLDLGYAAFFAIGAYTYAYSNSPFSGQDLPFLPMLVIGAGIAAVFGIALGAPTLRLRGDYLAIMTLGFGEIVPIMFLNLDKYTQGTNGIGGIDRPNIFGFVFPGIDQLPYYILMTTVLIVVIILMYRLQD